MGRLLSAQNSEHNGRVEICRSCLHIFSGDGAAERLQHHADECLKISPNSQRVSMPAYGQITFHGKKNCMSVPYKILADFETINVKTGNGTGKMADLQICGFAISSSTGMEKQKGIGNTGEQMLLMFF